MKIAIIGAGNGGQALAGWLGSKGFEISLYDRNPIRIQKIKNNGGIELTGQVNVKTSVKTISDDIDEIIQDAELILVATTATAHKEIAEKIAKTLTDGQAIVLNPGRTGGALEFRNTLKRLVPDKRLYVAEAQTLVFACRIIEDGKVNIIGIKDRVLVSAIPSSDTPYVISCLAKGFDCFYPAKNILETSFENIGAMFHPCVTLFNEAAIERGESFYFYRDMTEGLSRLIEETDRERLEVAKAFGYEAISAKEWVSYAYGGIKGDTLCERMQNNPAYYDIIAPKTINCRQITEDIPTGIVPLAELGKVAGVPTPLLDSLITMCSLLLGIDFKSEGRNIHNLGLTGMTKDEIIRFIDND